MIRFKCIYCGEPLDAPVSLAGGKIDCPQCSHSVIVRQTENPGPEDNNVSANDDILLEGPPVRIQMNDKPNYPLQATGPSELPPPTPDQMPKIHFRCTCGQALKASMQHAGKRITCPHCSQKRTIPEKSEY